MPSLRKQPRSVPCDIRQLCQSGHHELLEYVHSLLQRTTRVHGLCLAVAASRLAVTAPLALATAALAVTASRLALATAWVVGGVRRPVPRLRNRLRRVLC